MFRPNVADKATMVISKIWEIWDIDRQPSRHTTYTQGLHKWNTSEMFGPNTADKAALVVAKIWNITRQHSQHNLVTVLLLTLEKVLLK